MPIPFLFIGIAATTAALGVGKTIKAGMDIKDAKETSEKAQDIVDSATKNINIARANCGQALQHLGEQKIDILENDIAYFIKTFEQLHNVELTDSVGINELNKFTVDQESIAELKELENIAVSTIAGITSGTAMGALTAFGAFSAAKLLAVASTGVAIKTLGGVAATNATLAFFGGGSLAIGGLGMAGGTAVLGGLVAGPALAVMGFIVGAKASKSKDQAYSNLAKAHEYKEEAQLIESICKGIRMRANLYERMLIKLDTVFLPLVYSLENIIGRSGTNYATFSYEEKKIVASSMAVAGAIKAILDTPILTEEGNLTAESLDVANKVNNFLKS